MVVPDGAGKPRQISLHISVITLVLVGWIAVTALGSYFSAQHIDYWRTQISNKVLQSKVNYLLSEIDTSRGKMDEVKQIEVTLRQMLKLNTEAINVKKQDNKEPSTGGPTPRDQGELVRLLENQPLNISWDRLFEKVKAFKEEAQSRVGSYDNLSDWLGQQRELYHAIPKGWPCPGQRTSHFGERLDPFRKVSTFHFGVDIAGPKGTPIRATADGIVQMANWHSGYGNLVVIDHKHGYSTRYAHNSKTLVKVGDRVKRGQIVALMGNTGKSSGSHCHYEVWKHKQRRNPYTFMIGETSQINELSKLPSEKLPLKN